MNSYQRYNVFNNIHKGLRGMLFHLQITIQQTDFTHPEAGAVIAEMEKALRYFDEHADHEDRFILANIAALEPSIVQELENDHVIDHNLSEALRGSITQWKNAVTDNEKEMAGKQLFFAMNEFIAFNLYHMNKEENQLLLLLWKHFTDEEIHSMEQQIIAAIDPEVLMAESRWMMRSLSVPEISGWLEGIRMGAPEAVYQMYLGMAREELSAERMAQVEEKFALNY
ncbi:hemerythrin domain-containing protein [Flavobacterium album]|nr:hemerythrin domain-containing protein [Flavobacterium album]